MLFDLLFLNFHIAHERIRAQHRKGQNVLTFCFPNGLISTLNYCLECRAERKVPHDAYQPCYGNTQWWPSHKHNFSNGTHWKFAFSDISPKLKVDKIGLSTDIWSLLVIAGFWSNQCSRRHKQWTVWTRQWCEYSQSASRSPSLLHPPRRLC